MLIVTRPPGKAQETQAKLSKLMTLSGNAPEIKHIPLTRLKSLPALHQSPLYPAGITSKEFQLIFTSQAAVKFWLNSPALQAKNQQEQAAWHKIPCWVVGTSAAQLLKQNDYNIAHPTFLDAADLFQHLAQELAHNRINNPQFLYICAQDITLDPRHILPEFGHYFQVHPIYAAQARSRLKMSEVQLLKDESEKTILIYSKRNAELLSLLVQRYGIPPQKLNIVAISAKAGAPLLNQAFSCVNWPIMEESSPNFLDREEAMLRIYLNNRLKV